MSIFLQGIRKQKRGRMVYDEIKQDWVPRWGYKSVKKNAEAAQWLIEHKDTDKNLESDPFSKQKSEKNLLLAKQKMRELRNKVEGAGYFIK